MQQGKTKNTVEAFATEPVGKLVIQNCIPALIAMVMVMVYSLADTYFIGKTHDDLQVAAVSMAAPVFMIFMSLGTLFGVGGTSVISRALGAGDIQKAKKASAFCMWACVAVGVVMTVGLLSVKNLPVMLGANEETFGFAKDYLSIVLWCGVFAMISSCFSCILRTEGEAMKAMTGTVLGNLLNFALDPIFILVLNQGIAGAAVATVIGNAVGAVYYVFYFLRGKSKLSIHPKDFSMSDGIFKDVLYIGLSASLANLLVSVSTIVVNGQLGKYGELGSMFIAGYGVASKVLMIVTLLGIGVGSGVQPMIGYYYGAKNRERLTRSIRFAAIFGMTICLAASALCWVFAEPIVKVFLTEEASLESGVQFTRILMYSAWLIGAFAICQNSLQAMGAATPALLASIFRQGVIFIPAMFLLKALFSVVGLVWAQPVADVLSLVLVYGMLKVKLKKWEREITPSEEVAK